MKKIVRLSTHIANMIAAGEVVERPSSVVKELVENSIDANSSKISIHLIDSGIKEINVIDDGCGMSSEDTLEAFNRHSTSKIKTEQDLFRINTLGFRGEALPSIMAVSYTRVLTNDGSGGFEVIYKAGSFLSSQIKACNIGTNILVKDLFFNTPARLKYLKSLNSELASVVFLVGRFSLSHPTISFTLTNNKKEIISTSGNNDIVRLFGELYGLEVAKNLIINEYKTHAYKFKLVLVKPEISRASKNELTVITNKRYVKSSLLTNAIIEGYNTYLPTSRYPIGCLYLDIDPLLIDVNVHPSKQIIKISNEEEIFQMVKNLVKETLQNVNNIFECRLEENKTEVVSYKKESIFNNLSGESSLHFEKPKSINSSFKNEQENIVSDINYKKILSNISTQVEENTDIKTLNQETQIAPAINEKYDFQVFPYMEYIGSFNLTYLLFQTDDGLMLLDQHAAAERINYEKIYQLIKDDEVVVNQLLLPYQIEFSKDEMLYIEDNTKFIESLGFELTQSGFNSYVIRTTPKWCLLDDLENVLRSIVNHFKNNKLVDMMYFRDYLCKQISCKSSIKANKSLNKNEITALLEGLKKCDNPFFCPHGRPTTIKITTKEIEKMFKRIM